MNNRKPSTSLKRQAKVRSQSDLTSSPRTANTDTLRNLANMRQGEIMLTITGRSVFESCLNIISDRAKFDNLS